MPGPFDAQATATKYGGTSNWNALRGSTDPLFAGLDPNANWNALRPSDAFQPGGSPTIPPTSLATTPSQVSPSTFTPQGTKPSGGYSFPAAVPGEFGVDDNSPGNVTFAGFSPQAHASDWQADPRYIAYDFLNRNGLTPDAPNWVDQIIAQYPGMYFKDPQGQLGWNSDQGYEYIGSRPLGYGMVPGSYDANTNPNEFFWGYTGGTAAANAQPPAAAGGVPRAGAAASPASSNASATAGTSSGLSGLVSQLQSLFGPAPAAPALPSGLAPPGGALSPDLNQVGQDPLSQLLDSAIGGVIQTGGTPYGQNIAETIKSLIDQGGLTGATSQRLVAARDAEATSEQGMLADARAQLAGMGTVGEPGHPQGPELSAVRRIAESLAPTFANEVSGIESHALDTQNQNVMDALSLATGLSRDMAGNVLQAIGTGTARQQVLADIALRTLDQNRQWQQFLAQHNLDRDRLMNDIQQGRIQTLIPLLSLFLQGAKQSAEGFI